jgi:hypothetical protein
MEHNRLSPHNRHIKNYAYIYKKIKEATRGNIIRHSILKEVLVSVLICKEGRGGNTKGMPKIYLYEIINDLIYWKLIERIDHTKYKILTSNCEKSLKKFF